MSWAAWRRPTSSPKWPVGRPLFLAGVDALLVGDADGEPAGAGAEIGLALGKSAERIGSGEFRHRRYNIDSHILSAGPILYIKTKQPAVSRGL